MNMYSINIMKIAIASEGKTEDSKISGAAGRALYYLIFEDKKLVKTIENPFRRGSGGAGYSVARMLANEKIDEVVAGQFGGNMTGALEENGIKSKTASGKVKEVIQ
jgi:predicted Fe-Mo cluster-binding NifX family protein